jgi:hypothetical protein
LLLFQGHDQFVQLGVFHDASDVAGMSLLSAARRLGLLINAIAGLSGHDTLQDQIEHRFKHALGDLDTPQDTEYPYKLSQFERIQCAICLGLSVVFVIVMVVLSV